MNYKIISIDSDIVHCLKVNRAYIIGVYTSTIHLFLNGELLTLGHSISKGKHHVVIDRDIDFVQHEISKSSEVTFDVSKLSIGDLIFEIEHIDTFLPYLIQFQIDDHMIHLLETLKTYIKDHHTINHYNYPKSDLWLNYQFKKIDSFLHEPSYKTAQAIVGLGIGLTPLGDDILTGFILARNTLGLTDPWILDIISYSKTKTNLLSYQNLYDTQKRLYPEIYINMIEGLWIDHEIEHSKAVLNLGATSGAGILTGFIYGLSV